jgi:glycerol-3-phosphate acyltransferase PlsY
MAIYIFIAFMAYLLGSIPFGLLLARVFLGTDVRQIGSGNIGATNVLRTGSKKLGIATLLLDAGKGFLAVTLAHRLAGGDARQAELLTALAAVLAMVGHVFPVWLKFKGGKGVATGVGVFLALIPKAVLIVLAVFIVIFALCRYVSLASIVATAAFPVVSWFYVRETGKAVFMPFIVAAALLIIVKHHQNIRRLLSGTEHRLEFNKR